MSTSYDDEIARTEAEIDQRLQGMDAVRQEIAEAAGTWLAGWYGNTAADLVKADPERTASMGAQLSELKQRVKALQDRAAGIAKDRLAAPTLWWHMQQKDQRYESSLPTNALGILDAPLRGAAGLLAGVLRPPGYIQDRGEGRPHVDWMPTREFADYFSGALRPSPEMLDAAERYGSLRVAAIRLQQQLAQLRIAKDRAQAGELWDKA